MGTLVGMMDHLFGVALSDHHVERCEHQFGTKMMSHGPPTTLRLNTSSTIAKYTNTSQAGLVLQTRHPFAVHPAAVPGQLRMYLKHPVGASGSLVDRPDRPAQLLALRRCQTVLKKTLVPIRLPHSVAHRRSGGIELPSQLRWRPPPTNQFHHLLPVFRRVRRIFLRHPDTSCAQFRCLANQGKSSLERRARTSNFNVFSFWLPKWEIYSCHQHRSPAGVRALFFGGGVSTETA